MPIDPRTLGSNVDSLLTQIFGPVNNILRQVPKAPTDISNYTDNPSPSALQIGVAGLLGALQGLAPRGGLPTHHSRISMPPGYRKPDRILGQPGTSGAKPEADFLGMAADGGRLRGSSNMHEIQWRANDSHAGFANPEWNAIFRNMPDFPAPAPRTPIQSVDPYAGQRQGMARTTWKLTNEQRHNIIKRLSDPGAPRGLSAQIAQEHGVSRAAVSQLMRRSGNPVEHRPLLRNAEEVRSMLTNSDLSNRQIASQFGVNEAAIRQYIQRHNIQRPAPQSMSVANDIAPMVREMEQRLLRSNLAPNQIAAKLREHFNLTDQQVTPLMIRNGTGSWRKIR